MLSRNVRQVGLVGARRRRSVDSEPLKKSTFQLRASVTEAIKAAVQAGDAPSANALVEDAVTAKLREIRRARVYAAYATAAQDAVFLAEMEATDTAFGAAVGDGLSDPR